MKEDGSEQDRRTIELIESIASQVRAAIESGLLPAIRMPTRSLENVTYDNEAGYLELGNKEQVRALTVNTARAFAQTLRLMAASRAMVVYTEN
jgi:DNA topoisomerase-6 subunit A